MVQIRLMIRGRAARFDRDESLLKEARETWNHAVSDKIVHLRNLLGVAGASFPHISHHYIEGSAWFECHMTFKVQGDTHHLLAVVEADDAGKPHRRIGKVENRDLSMDGNMPVFVDIGEQIQQRQRMVRWVRSVIRLKALDKPNCHCGYSACPPGKQSPGDLCVGIENGELCSSGAADSKLGELPHGLVQRGTEAVHQVAENERNLVRKILDLDPDFIPSLLEIYFSKKLDRFGIAVNIQPILQSVKVYLRPFGFQVGTQKGRAYPV